MKVIFIGIIVAVLLIIVFYFLNKNNTQKSLEKVGQPWAGVVQNFRRIAPHITTLEQLEKYLSSINSEVKKYETNYHFLIAFNSEIRKIREQLKKDKSDV